MKSKGEEFMQGKKNGKTELYEEKRRKVMRFNLTSDVFFSKVMEDTDACQELIRILTKKNLIVKSVKTQYSIRNMENHSIVLDVLAEDQEGRIVNIEIHPQEDEDHVRRVRYYLSSIDMSYLEKGASYQEVPEVYLVYITEKDFVGEGRGIYQVNRTVSGCQKLLDNGTHEFYVNLTGITEQKDQQELLHFIKKSDSSHQTTAFPHLVERVRMLKEQKEGVDIMCAILEQERLEGRTEGRTEGEALVVMMIRKKVNKGLGVSDIADNLELDEMYVKAVVDLITGDGSRTDQQIAGILISRENEQ